jgi:MFS family permease
MIQQNPSPLRAWMTVALLWFVGCLNYIDRVMITTMRQSLVDAIPMTDAQFGLLTTVFLFVYAALSPFAGYLADRFNRSVVIIVSLVVWSAITWLTAHATTFNQLLLTRALMGVSEACYIPAALALIADYHGPKTRSLANGTHLSGVMIGAGLGGLGGWIAERHGWAQAFVWFGQIGIVLAVVLVLYLRDRRPEHLAQEVTAAGSGPVHLGEAITSLFSRREFSLALGYWGLLGASVWAVVGWMPTYLNEHFHLSQGVAGLSATGYYQGASLAGVILGGVWADRWSSRQPQAPILVPLVGMGVAAPAILLAASTDHLPVAIAGLMAFGLSKAFADANMMPILTLISDRRFRATGYGVLNLCACVVGGLTIYAGGALRDARVDVSHVFQFGAGSIVVCGALLYLVLRAHRRCV